LSGVAAAVRIPIGRVSFAAAFRTKPELEPVGMTAARRMFSQRTYARLRARFRDRPPSVDSQNAITLITSEVILYAKRHDFWNTKRTY